MGELYERYIAALERDKQNREVEKQILKEQEHNTPAQYIALKEAAEAKRKSQAKLGALRVNLTDMLMAESIAHIASKALGEGANENIIGNCAHQFVQEQGGASRIMYKTVMPTYTLECLFNRIDDKVSALMEKAKDDDALENNKKIIDKEDIVDFLDRMDKDYDVENMSLEIATRIANGEEAFINSNLADKAQIKSIVDDTAERIKNAKEDEELDNDTQDKIVESYQNIGRSKINDIHNDRPQTVFEAMVRTMSESVMKSDTALHEAYTNNGKLDMEKIVNNVKSVYAFLETVNTMQIIKVDSNFIESLLG